MDFFYSIQDLINFSSYWDIILLLLSYLTIIPFIYLIHLINYKVENTKLTYYFEHNYDLKNLITHINEFELLFSKRFENFKNLLEKLDKDSEGNLWLHSEVIDSILLCIKFNGQNRFSIFWNLSDTLLKVIILSLPLIGATIVLISYIYYDVGESVLSFIAVIITLPVLLVLYSYFLKLSIIINKKIGKPLPSLNLAYTALESLVNWNISRSKDKETGEHFYYTTIHKYNNTVNENLHFTNVYVPTSSMIYGNLKEQALGEKK